MDLFERYVHEVGRHLPRRHRERLLEELRTRLEVALQAQDEGAGAGLPADDEARTRVLRGFDSPETMARQLSPARKWLIGPEYYHGFSLTVRVCAVALLVAWIQGLIGFVDWGLDGREATAQALRITLQLMQTGLMVLGFLTLIFAILERVVEGKPKLEPSRDWDPASLPRFTGRDAIARTSPMVRFALAILALGVISLAPGTVGGSFYSYGTERGWVPLLGPGMVAMQIWLIGLMLLEIGLSLRLLVHRSWSPALRGMDLIIKAAWVFALISISRSKSLHVDADWLIAKGWTSDAARTYEAEVLRVLAPEMSVIFGLAACAVAVFTLFRLWQHYKAMTGKTTAPA